MIDSFYIGFCNMCVGEFFTGDGISSDPIGPGIRHFHYQCIDTGLYMGSDVEPVGFGPSNTQRLPVQPNFSYMRKIS
jgi:hypothetical protein